MRHVLSLGLLILTCLGVNPLQAQQELAGAIGGTFDVSDLGAATYHIPIKVPPGIGGVQPDISLGYNSQNGSNGLLGYGWSLSATSVISRTGNTIYHDSKTSGVTFTTDDKFALDGSRLILTTGTVYGAANTEYRTESESYQKIKALDIALFGSGPRAFEVTGSNGWKYEYGTHWEAQALVLGKVDPYAWLLRKVTDLNGNYLTYEYYNDIGEEVRIKNIQYTGNSTTGLTPRTRVDFVYATKGVENFAAIAGVKIVSKYVLERINIVQANTAGTMITTHSYRLEYDAQGEHLRKVRNIALLTNEELKPTNIDYIGSGSAAYSQTDVSGGQTINELSEFTAIDLDGDSKSDLLQYCRNFDCSDNNILVHRGTGSGFNPLLQSIPTHGSARKIERLKRNFSDAPLDFNGDGKEDFLYRTVLGYVNNGEAEGNCVFNLRTSNGNGLIDDKLFLYGSGQAGGGRHFVSAYPIGGDFDGDGKSEVITFGWDGGASNGYNGINIFGMHYIENMNIPNNNIYRAKALTANDGLPARAFQTVFVNNIGVSAKPTNEEKYFAVDYNGDGKNEILIVKNGTSAVYEMNVTFDANKNPVWGSPMFRLVATDGYPTVWHDITPGDFNGDGITDILTYNDNSHWEIGYGKGDGRFSDIRPFPFSMVRPKAWDSPGVNAELRSRRRSIIVGDFNGDGKADVFDYAANPVGASSQSPRILYAKGNNVFTSQALAIPANALGLYDYDYTLGDFNGDGKVDFLTNTPSQPLFQFSFGGFGHEHRVSRITDGDGVFTTIGYKYLSEPGATWYSNGATGYSFPIVSRPLPVSVVNSVRSDNGKDATGNETTFSYSGLKYANWGKGLLGFDKVIRRDLATNSRTENIYELNTSFFLPLLVTQQSYQANVLVSTSSNAYRLRDFGSKRFFSYLYQNTFSDELTKISSRTTNIYEESINLGGLMTYEHTFHIGKPKKIISEKGIYGLAGSYGTALEVNTQTYSYYPGNGLVVGNIDYHRYFLPNALTSTTVRKDQPAYTRVSRFTYNDAKGWLTRLVTDPNTAYTVTTNSSYNSYGNLTDKTTTSAGLPAISETTEYDPSQRFATTNYNPAFPLLKSVKTHNQVLAQVSSESNVNGLVTTFTYDGFGRLKTASDNKGKTETTSRMPVQYGYGAPAGAAITVVESNNITAPVYKHYDRLGRLLRTVSTGFNMEDVFEDKEYNNKGQLYRESQPYFQGSTPLYTTYTYDSYGRTTQAAAPNGNTQTSYSSVNSLNNGTNNASYTVTTTNPAGQSSSRTMDASGMLVSALDNGGTIGFVYHSCGKVLKTLLNGALVTSSEYDPLGRETRRTDANYGTYEYTYDNYGQLKTQKDPKNTTYTMTYNETGDMVTKIGPEGTYTYTYNNTVAGNSLGMLTQVSSPGNISESYTYAAYGRLTGRQQTIDGVSFSSGFVYDIADRVIERTFPNNTRVSYSYSPISGELAKIYLPQNFNNSVPNELYSVWERDRLGKVTRSRGRSLTVGLPSQGPIPQYQTTYNTETNTSYSDIGLLQSIHTTNLTANYLFVENEYAVDPQTGNLSSRRDEGYTGCPEFFTYDNLNRLTGVDPTCATPERVYGYAQNGNLTQKSDAGTFTYNAANKVAEITPYVMIPSETQDITYTPSDMVATISENGRSVAFSYWENGERAKMLLANNGVTYKTKYYTPDFEREVDQNGNVRELSYIRDENGHYVAIIEKQDGVEKSYTVLTDYLGSIERIIDNNTNTVVAYKSYDAWGRERNAATWDGLPPTAASTGWDRGYTGHEHLPEFGLINMNGRLYDPLLGRMLSPDPYIMGTDNTQGYNRYTYALNNPLKYNDPSGHIANWVLSAAVSGVASWATYGFSTGKWFTGGALGAFGTGALAGALGSIAGSAVSAALPFGGFFNGAISGGVSGAVGGFVYGGGNALLSGTDFSKQAVQGALWGFASGAVGGGLTSGIIASVNHRDFFNGGEITYKVIGEAVVPNEQQRGDMNCLGATVSAVEQSFGGSLTQEDVRRNYGGNGDPQTEPMDTKEVLLGYTAAYKRGIWSTLGMKQSSVKTILVESVKQPNMRVIVSMNTSNTGGVTHAVVVRRVTAKYVNGNFRKYIFEVMDPAVGRVTTVPFRSLYNSPAINFIYRNPVR